MKGLLSEADFEETVVNSIISAVARDLFSAHTEYADGMADPVSKTTKTGITKCQKWILHFFNFTIGCQDTTFYIVIQNG